MRELKRMKDSIQEAYSKEAEPVLAKIRSKFKKYDQIPDKDVLDAITQVRKLSDVSFKDLASDITSSNFKKITKVLDSELTEGVYKNTLRNTEVDIWLKRNLSRMDPDTAIGVMMDKFQMSYDMAEAVVIEYSKEMGIWESKLKERQSFYARVAVTAPDARKVAQFLDRNGIRYDRGVSMKIAGGVLFEIELYSEAEWVTVEQELKELRLFKMIQESTIKEERKFDLSAGKLGNGITVVNKAKEVDGDYEKIAHISNDKKVTWYLKDAPKEVEKYVDKLVKESTKKKSTVITIKEEVTIGDTVLEVGDRIEIIEEKDPDIKKIIKDNNIQDAEELEDYLLQHHTMFHKKLDDMSKVTQSFVVDLLNKTYFK